MPPAMRPNLPPLRCMTTQNRVCGLIHIARGFFSAYGILRTGHGFLRLDACMFYFYRNQTAMERKILIIDDEEDICLLMKNYLQRRQADVKYALNLKDGLKLLEEFHPDIIFLDNNLPDGIGLEEIRTIKKSHNQIQLVMISAMNHLREAAFREGADHFLDKPISFKAVVAVI